MRVWSSSTGVDYRGPYVDACSRRDRADVVSLIRFISCCRRQSTRSRAARVLFGGSLLCGQIFGVDRRNVGAQPWRHRRADRSGAALFEEHARADRRGDALVRALGPDRSTASLYELEWSTKATGVPFFTSAAKRSASQLVRRTQPCEAALLTLPGSGVPCMP